MTKIPELIYTMLACSRIGASSKHASASTQATTPRATGVAGTKMYSTFRDTGSERRRSKARSSSTKPAVVGFPLKIKGEGIHACVVVNNEFETAGKKELIGTLKPQVRSSISTFAALDVIHLASGLPRPRGGKIMRRILRKVSASDDEGLGGLTTLAELNVVCVLINEHKREPKKQGVPLALSPNHSTIICAMDADYSGLC